MMGLSLTVTCAGCGRRLRQWASWSGVEGDLGVKVSPCPCGGASEGVVVKVEAVFGSGRILLDTTCGSMVELGR